MNLVLEPKKAISAPKPSNHNSEELLCPKCQKGTILKGKTAFGCSDYKHGCDFIGLVYID